MVTPNMNLTSQAIKNIKPDPIKSKKHFDGGGLFLEVTPTGAKRWRFKYRFGGKEKLISLGLYPAVGLKEAREKRDDAKKALGSGIDPSAQRQAQKESLHGSDANGFEVVALEWISQNEHTWAPSHAKTIKNRLQNDVFPFVGKIPAKDLTPQTLIEVLRRVEKREAFETAHRIRTVLGQVFRYAIATGRVETDPTRDLKGALKPVIANHLPAVTDPNRVAEILRMIDAYRGGPVVTTALKLAPLVFVRPGELRQAEWADIDFDKAEWRYLVKKTKTPHIVPLATQAVAALKELYPITGLGKYVFPTPRTNTRPMSDNAILAALRSMGIPKEEMCGHGFRATARTILDEVLKIPPHLIEHQLAHAVRDSLGRAYNRTTHLEKRKEMMQKWADYLDELRGGK